MSFLHRLFGKPPRDPYTYEIDKERVRLRAVQAALDGPYGDNATLFDTTRKLVEAADFPSPTSFAITVANALIDRCDRLREPLPRPGILKEMTSAAAGLYAAERLRDLPPNPALYGIGADSAPLGALRDLLLRQQRKAAYPKATLDALTEALVDCFLAVTRRLPTLARSHVADEISSEDAISIPLFNLLQNTGAVIDECLKPFASAKAAEIGLFQWLRGQLDANSISAAEQMRSKSPVSASHFAGSSAEVIAAYLTDTPLAAIFAARVPFTISIANRLEHTAIIAGSGWGKTQLLQAIVADDLRLPDPPAMVVIDSTNRIVDRVQHLALFSGRLKDRIIIIDPERSPTPALNMFDLNTPRMAGYADDMRERVQTDIIALFNYVFSSIQNPLTDPMRTAFSYMVRLLISIPNANINTLRKLLEDSPKGGYEASAFKSYIDKLDPTAKDFFRLQFYTERVRATKDSILQRVSSVISVPAFERMFSTVNKVDFFEEMQRGSCILVNTSEALLKDGSPLFGRYIIVRVMAAAFERASLPDDQRRPCFLVVDEAAPYFDDQFEKLLTRVRQFKLGVVIAFQHLEQTTEKLRSAIASNTSIKFAGGLGYADSRWLAREMRTTPENLLALRKDYAEPPRFTNYACSVRGMDVAATLTLPFYRMENMPMMAAAEHAELLERNKGRTAEVFPKRHGISTAEPANTPGESENTAAPAIEAEDCPAQQRPVPIVAAPLDPGEPADTW